MRPAKDDERLLNQIFNDDPSKPIILILACAISISAKQLQEYLGELWPGEVPPEALTLRLQHPAIEQHHNLTYGVVKRLRRPIILRFRNSDPGRFVLLHHALEKSEAAVARRFEEGLWFARAYVSLYRYAAGDIGAKRALDSLIETAPNRQEAVWLRELIEDRTLPRLSSP